LTKVYKAVGWLYEQAESYFREGFDKRSTELTPKSQPTEGSERLL